MELSHIYNPANQTAEELIESFVIRRKEFNDLMNDIQRDKMRHPPQHYIIQGQRGTGKTTLILRLYHEIKRNKDLMKWMLPITFSEEQYNIRTLFKLWEEFAIRLEKEDQYFFGLEDEVNQIDYTDHDDYEEKIYNLISKKIKKSKRKVTLFIDNIGLLFVKFKKKDQQRLREVLLTDNNFRIVGASAYVLESIYDYIKPFYEFFKVINLNPLNLEETKTLLLTLDEKYKTGTIPNIIETQPGRIEALRRITGGIPRTIVLLFEIFSDNENGNSLADLEIILDKATPLYKHRMDDLPAQQQEFAHIIAMNWDAMSTGDIAKRAKMESKVVSSQLRLMVTNGLITKISSTTKNHLYQISERFFNIWYLMRFGVRKERDKVKWLVKFLEVWCSPDELVNRANRHMSYVRNKTCKMHEKYAFYFSEALADAGLPEDLQHKLLTNVREYLKKVQSPLENELSKSDKEIKETITSLLEHNEEYQKILPYFLDIRNKNVNDYFPIIAIYEYELKKYAKSDYYLFKLYEVLKDKFKSRHDSIDVIYNSHAIDIMMKLQAFQSIVEDDDKNVNLVIEKINKEEKELDKFVEKEGVKRKINNELFMGIINHNIMKRYKLAEFYYLESIKNNEFRAVFNLALLYDVNLKDYKRAEKYYKMAVNNGDSIAMTNLGLLYMDDLHEFKKAEKYYLMAIEKGETGAMVNLGVLNTNIFKDFVKAEKFYKMAYEKGETGGIVNLGSLYQDEYKDFVKAEKYFKMAIDKGDTHGSNGLAWMLFEINRNKTKALELSRKGLTDSDNVYHIHTFVIILLWNNKFSQAKKKSKELFSNSGIYDRIQDFSLILEMFMAKKQFHFLYKVFNESKFDIKDRFKAHYYTLMNFMKDEYPNEHLKMGEELKQTVDEIIEKIQKLEKDYK